jgi:hypothetical protein
MTPNLKLARQAVATELNFAKQGMAYYLSRVEALEQALDQLESVSTGHTEPAKTKTAAGRKGKAAQPKDRPRMKAGAREGRNFPTTGGDFWLELITDQPQSAVDIANAAAVVLGFADDKAQVQVLKQRVSPALNALVESKKVKDAGAGRERRFFKA